jgi:radical SAM superfamily enzyme YgiQ (UPF0313 family)
MYLKGFLNTQNIGSFQMDLSLEVILSLFSKEKLSQIFDYLENSEIEISDNSFRILSLKNEYLSSIDSVIRFLQGRNSSLAYSIVNQNFLPQASRFEQLIDLETAFGNIGLQDKAKYLATLFLQDLSDLIRECIDPFFGFSKYAERLSRSASSFDALNEQLTGKETFIDEICIELLTKRFQTETPDLVLITVPFPGNLYSALRIGKYIKENHPKTKIAIGGGYPNTELRNLKDPRIFKFIDFITLDDGEKPVLNLINFIEGKITKEQLKRTYLAEKETVEYIIGNKEKDFSFANLGTPDYSDLMLNSYLSVLEIANPMHRLWSDGRWNKLTMAHGCYWKKCSFCDISLDYISKYEPVTANILCDRIQNQITQTGETGFHFVDEAAPPALMKELALEILRRKIKITWWANIRFEEAFSRDLCRLLAQSGCVAVSGGLEVASNRLLELMQKGVSVEQVAQVCSHFTDAGILVHAYLMYGFPTQTAQETIDSLEFVRQMFELGIVQSGFWHQFAMTYHSPVGKNPEKYKVKIIDHEEGGFAQNDLFHEDPTGANHEIFSDGLAKSLFNFMQGIGTDFPLQDWFDFKVPKTKIKANHILESIENEDFITNINNKKVVFFGENPEFITQEQSKFLFRYELRNETVECLVSNQIKQNIEQLLKACVLKDKNAKNAITDENFYQNKIFNFLNQKGLLLV